MHAMWERIEPLKPAFLSVDQSDDAVEEIVPCLEQVFYDWFCHRLQQHRADAEDLAARTVERIVINRGGFDYRGPGSFRAWCYRIAENVLNDWAASERKWGAHTVSDEEWRALEDTTSIVDPSEQEDDEPSLAVSVRNVFQMLTALEQAALAMQVIDNLSDEEIARNLDSSTAVVKQARYRAKQKFRKLLSADPRFADQVTTDTRSIPEPNDPTETDSTKSPTANQRTNSDAEDR
jgi:RNA polymerase sigma factor (sigma-70 family)